MSTPVLHIHRPHRMHRVDAAYCYNGVAWSACLSVCVCGWVGHTGEPCKNGWTADRYTVWFADSCEPKKPDIAHWRQLANTTEKSMRGEDAALCQITMTTCYYKYILMLLVLVKNKTFSALTLLVGRQEGHPACKKLSGGVLAWLSVCS